MILQLYLGEMNAVWEELDCVASDDGSCSWNVDFDVSIVIKCWSNMPAILSIEFPGRSFVGMRVNYYFGSWRGHRC